MYGPLYFDYGGENEPQGGPWTRYAPYIEKQLLKLAPDVTLVSVKASPEVIARRMKGSSHASGVLREADIKHVLHRFEEEYEMSQIHNKLGPRNQRCDRRGDAGGAPGEGRAIPQPGRPHQARGSGRPGRGPMRPPGR